MDWTPGRLKSFITSTIRSGFRRYPAKYEVLKKAFVQKGLNPATGRMAAMYRCNDCQMEFSAKNVQVDHVKPVVDPKKGFVDWNTFIERLFCDASNLQVLCLNCHKTKTTKEKAVANKTKAKISRTDV